MRDSLVRSLAALAALFAVSSASAQTTLGTAFTYQGRLADGGSAANGPYDMEFRLFDALSAGNPVGTMVNLGSVPVSGGLFTTTLDFGPTAFGGQRRWLEIRVRPAGGGGYTTLSPRQEVAASPNASWSSKAGDALALGGVSASGYMLAGTVVSVSQGGTGATDAAGARTNLQAAKSGANSDITSLSGLTTPVSIAQGGTGATNAAGALTSLNAQARVTGDCPAGQYLREVNADGTVACGTDVDTNNGGTVTNVATGAGLAGGPIVTAGTLSIANGGVTSSMFANGAVGLAQIDTSQVQARLAAACATEQYLRGMGADGSVVCTDLFDVGPAATPASVVSATAVVPNGSYGIGSSIPILVLFSKPVKVSGNPTLTLETGSTDGTAAYSFSLEPNLLLFDYTVAAGHATPYLDYQSTAALALNGGSIANLGGVAANLTLPVPGAAGSISNATNIVVDGVAPTVTGAISSIANGSYKAGAVIDVRVTFSEAVFVIGVPRITLETGSSDAIVSHSSGSSSSTLVFNYTVVAGHVSPDLDYVSTTALAFNGGTIRDGAGNNAVPTLPSPGAAGSLGANQDIVIDTSAPLVSNVTSTTPNGSYTAGAVIDVRLTFTEPVAVVGAPGIMLETGVFDAVAGYTSGGGTSTLVFTYNVGLDQSSPDLDYASPAALVLNGGAIRDTATNNAVLTLPAPGAIGSLGANRNIVVMDTTPPSVLNVTSTTPPGSKGIGATIPIQVVFSEPVYVSGLPLLTLNVGAAVPASYSSGSSSNTLVFVYTVGPGHTSADLDYMDPGSLILNGGSIQDVSLNSVNPLLPVPGAPGSLGANCAIVIDTTAPIVTNVTSPAPDGTYGVGAMIPIHVTFSEPVTVTGMPQLALALGMPVPVDYAFGSGSSTLVFNYLVAPGQSTVDLDYLGPGALSGGTIRDEAGNPSALGLPAPGTLGSLGFNKDIVIQ